MYTTPPPCRDCHVRVKYFKKYSEPIRTLVVLKVRTVVVLEVPGCVRGNFGRFWAILFNFGRF